MLLTVDLLKSQQQLLTELLTRGQQFICQDIWDEGVEGTGIIYKQHPHVAAAPLQEVQGSMESDGFEYELVVVQG